MSRGAGPSRIQRFTGSFDIYDSPPIDPVVLGFIARTLPLGSYDSLERINTTLDFPDPTDRKRIKRITRELVDENREAIHAVLGTQRRPPRGSEEIRSVLDSLQVHAVLPHYVRKLQ